MKRGGGGREGGRKVGARSVVWFILSGEVGGGVRMLVTCGVGLRFRGEFGAEEDCWLQPLLGVSHHACS